VKKISLTRGMFALVDDEDYEWLSQWKWYALRTRKNCFYVARQKNGKTVLMHREILNLKKDQKIQGHHKNHNTLDNRRKNLEIVNNRENNSNKKYHSKHGVGIEKKKDIRRQKPFRASVEINGKAKHIGYFTTAKKAQEARKEFLEKNGL